MLNGSGKRIRLFKILNLIHHTEVGTVISHFWFKSHFGQYVVVFVVVQHETYISEYVVTIEYEVSEGHILMRNRLVPVRQKLNVYAIRAKKSSPTDGLLAALIACMSGDSLLQRCCQFSTKRSFVTEIQEDGVVFVIFFHTLMVSYSVRVLGM